MAIFLGHRTAELVLNSPLAPDFVASDETPMGCGFLDHEVLSGFSPTGLGLPEGVRLDVMVARRDQRRRRKGLACHLSETALPHGAYLEIAPDLFVASPALCLIQLAPSLSFAGRIKLAARLCGSFAPSTSTESGLIERKPLATPESLLTFIDRCPNMRGVRQARTAVQWTLPNAASPMEIAMALPFYLPTRIGGFGLPRPVLNYELSLGHRAQALTGASVARIDAFWPDAGFGLEYQSKHFHHGDTAYGHDIGRQLAIEAASDNKINMVTKHQLQCIPQLERLAELVAERLDISFEPSKGRQHRERLMADILSA